MRFTQKWTVYLHISYNSAFTKVYASTISLGNAVTKQLEEVYKLNHAISMWLHGIAMLLGIALVKLTVTLVSLPLMLFVPIQISIKIPYSEMLLNFD